MNQEEKQSKLMLADSITKARDAMNAPGAVFAKADADGVEDLIAVCEQALRGEYRRPFTHSLHFLPDVDQAAFFNRFHTMITGWQTPYDMDRTYGMADAAEWIVGRDLARMDAEALRARGSEVKERADNVLGAYQPGEEVGRVNAACYNELSEAASALEDELSKSQADHRGLALAVARAADAVRDTLASQVLLFDRDDRANLFVKGGDADEFRQCIDSDPFLGDQYRQIKALADLWTPERVARLSELSRDNVPYDALNDEFRLWSSSETTFNFVTPADAVSARIELALPSCDNEADGLGHVWVDKLRVFGPDSGDWVISNPGFDEAGDDGMPVGWQDASIGSGHASLETDARYVFEGTGSLKLSNPDAHGEAVVITALPITVMPGAGSTATFMAKIDGTPVRGLVLTIRFYDANGEECGVVTRDFDRASDLKAKPGAALSCQADAIVAWVESVKDPEASRVYATKAKQEMLYELNWFCQGAEHWMVRNLRPYGCDAVGAVQAGRIMCSIADAYTLIAPMGVFSAEETERFLALCDYMLLYVTDARNRTSYSASEVQLGATNWQTDMFAGTVVLSLALLQAGVLSRDAEVRARRMVQDGVWFLKSQLNDHVNPDGSFPESLRYHMAALSRYTFVARVVGHATGSDWYKDTTLAPMFQYYADMVTPDYPFANTKIPAQPGEAEPMSAERYEAGAGVPSTPTFGDHQIGDGSEFAQLGLCAGDVQRVNPKLARQMLATWKRAGRPVSPFWTESCAFEHLLVNASAADGVDPTGRGDWGPLASNLDYPDSGIALFRKGFATSREQYLAVMASPKPIGHGHFDEGSFILYKDRVLVVADPGIIGYFDSSKDWLVSSSAHATMQFASRYGKLENAKVRADRLDVSNYSRKFGWVDTPREATVLSTSFGGAMEDIVIEIANSEGPGSHIRRVLWFPEPELTVVIDRVRDFDGRIRFTLPVAARALPNLANAEAGDGLGIDVRHECNYGLTLQTLFLAPQGGETPAMSAEWGLSSPVSPKVNGEDRLEFLRAETIASNGFTVLINPMRTGEPTAGMAWLADGGLAIGKGDWSATLTAEQIGDMQ